MPSKIADIQILRGFAVLMVMSVHLSALRWFCPPFLLYAWTGVDLFFVISGFVVAGSFYRGRSAVKRFYIKRAFRILPLALVCLVLWILAVKYFNQGGYFGSPTLTNSSLLNQSLAAVFFYSNYAYLFGTYLSLAFYWTLSVEEQFYVLYPLIVKILKTQKTRIYFWILVVLVVAFVLRPLNKNESTDFLRLSTQFRLDAIALGVLVFELTSRFSVRWNSLGTGIQKSNRSKFSASVFGYLLVTFIAAAPWIFGEGTSRMLVWGVFFVALAGAMVVALASFNLNLLSFGSMPFRDILVWIGERSFALYLIHIPYEWAWREAYLRSALMKKWHLDLMVWSPVAFAAFLLSLFLLAHLAHRFLESPMIEMGSKVSKNAELSQVKSG